MVNTIVFMILDCMDLRNIDNTYNKEVPHIAPIKNNTILLPNKHLYIMTISLYQPHNQTPHTLIINIVKAVFFDIEFRRSFKGLNK